MKTNLLVCLLLTFFVYTGKCQTACTPPTAPTVTSPVNYCQNATAIALTATGSNLLWGNTTQSFVGGTSTLSTVTYIDGSYNNKQVNFTTNIANVTINTIDYYIPAYQTMNGLVLAIFNNAGTIIATSSTITNRSAGSSSVKVTNTFNYTITTPGNYSIGVSAGWGNLGADNPAFPLTESTGTINITGVSTAGSRCFNNITFTLNASSTAPVPSTTTGGSFNYYVTQTVGGCTSAPAVINVIVKPSPAISQIPVSNLIANYRFEGNANDATGNNNGTLQNAPTAATDRFGNANKALSFNGINQYVSTANQYTNPTNFTISTWFKTAATTGGKLIGFGALQTGQSNQYDRQLYMTNGKIYFGVYPGTVKTINSPLAYNDNNWHLVTATLSSVNGMVLYIDGAQVAADPSTTTAEVTTGYWKIGFDNINGWTAQPADFYFTGLLDDALIYHTALSASDVMAIYTSPDGAGNNGPVCSGASLNLLATTVAGASYSWAGPNSFTSTSQNPSLTYSSANAGTYTLQASAGGCSSVAYTNVVSTTNAGQWTGNVSTDWATAGNWCNGGVPAATTNVVITAGATNMPSISSNVVCNNLIINTGATLTTTGAGTLNIYGTLTNNGTMSNSGTTVFNGTTGQQTFSGVTTFYNLILNNSNGLLLPAAIVVTNNLTLSAGILNANNFSVSIGGNWINNVSTSAFTAGTSTVTFNGTAAQSIGGSFATGFNNLTISNAGNTVSLAANATITGSLNVSSGTFNLSTFTANRTSAGGSLTVANNATLQIGGTNTFPTNYSLNTLVVASTVQYAGTNQTVASQTYGNLTLTSSSGAAVKTLPVVALTVLGNLSSSVGSGTSVSFTATTTVNVSGNVSIGASTTFNGGNSFHTIGGSWTNNGTFNGSTGTINFSGPGAQVGGSGTQNFYNLTVTASMVSFSNVNINVASNLTTSSSGSFSQVSGGSITMAGSGKVINGSGISFNDLVISGSITGQASFAIAGNLSVSGTLSATAVTITMSGASKTLSGSGTKSFGIFSVNGSITTASDFSISSALNVSGSLTASAGTATFTGTSTLSGTPNLFNITINGTSLQLSANSILGIANAMAITAGTFNTTSSTPNTVNYNGSGAQNIAAVVYNNLVLSNGNNKTATAGITINNSITISAGTTFIPGTYTHSIYNNWNNYGSFTAGSSTIQFLGTQNSTITGATTFNILTVNNTNQTTGLTLQNNVSAATVNMTSGTMFTGSNTLTITTTRTGNGIILGNITRTHAFTTGVAYAFEGPNNTITFSAISSVTSITVSVAKQSISDFPYNASIGRLYTIAIPSGTYTATLRLHYEDAELNGVDESTMGLWNYNGTYWIPFSKSANSTTSNYVEQSGLTNITNRWTCGYAQSVAQWNGSVSTDWNNAANWTTLVGSPSMPPAATDVVALGTGTFTNQPTVSTTVNVKNIVFGSAQAVNLSMASGGTLTSGDILGIWSSNATHTINANNQSITINGALSLSDGTSGHAINLNIGTGTVNVVGSLNQSGGANVVFSGAGNLNIANDFNYVNGTFTPATGTVTYNGMVNQAIASVNYNNLTVNNATATLSINNTTTINGALSIVAGELDNLATTTIAGNVSISSGATLYNTSVLHIKGNWINNGTYSSNGTGTNVIFDGTGTQSISASTFNNLEFNKPVGSTALLAGDVTLKGNLVGTSGTLDIGSYFFNRDVVGGSATMSDSATLIIAADNAPTQFANYYMAPNSTVIFNGTGTQHLFLPGLTYGNIIFRNSGTKILYTATNVNGDLTIENGATFNAGSNTITLNGNWNNSGTFVPATSTIVCTGTSKNFSGNTTFKLLSINGSYTFLNNNTIDSLLIINPTGSLSGGSTISTTMNGDLINKGILYTLGTTTFTGNVLQTLSLINAVQTVAITVNFNGSVSPVLNSTSAPQYGFLNINNTGGVNPSVGWNVLYSLTVGAGASFNGGASTHNFYGAVTNNGAITSSGVLNFLPASATTVNLGTNFSSTGRVVFGGTGSMTVAGTTDSFTNVDIINSNAAGITPSSYWNIANNLSISSGSILNAANYNYLIGGNISNNGTINSGNSTFTLNGTNTQNIYSPSAFHNLAINKTTGSTTMSSDVTVNDSLNFISGKIQTSTNSIIEPSGAIVTGASQTTGWVDGNLQKNIATGATNKTFETGDDNYYAPASVAFANVTTSGNLTARSVAGDHPYISNSSINASKSVNRYWSFTNSGIGFTTYGATFKYPATDLDAGASSSLFGVSIYNNSWSLPVTVATNDTSSSATGISAFGDLAIGEICNRNTSISYALSPYCSASGNATVTLTGNGGGIYSSSPGLSLDSLTSNVVLGTSVPGTYIVTYTINATGSCASFITTANIIITAAPTASGYYPGTPYCSGAGIAYPTGSSTGIGFLTSTTGLAIDSTTGGIDLDASTPGTYTVTYTIPASGGCTSFSWNTNVTIVTPGTWAGTVNTDWQNAGNWVCGQLPSASTNVTIDSGAASYPVITSTQALNNLTVQHGASLTVTGGTLKIGGTITNAGTMDASAGTIEMNGTSPQTIAASTFANNTILNLIAGNNITLADQLNLTGAISFDNNNDTLNTAGFLTLRSTAANTATVNDITNAGANRGNAIIGNVTVERYIPARRSWRLLTAPLTNTNSIYNAWQNAGVYTPGLGTLVTGPSGGSNMDKITNTSMYTFNTATQSFNTINNTNVNISAGSNGSADNTGYMIFIRGDRNPANFSTYNTNTTTLSAIGRLQTGSQTFAASSLAGKYALIGNPYTSPIDFNNVTRTNLIKRFYAWDPTLNTVGGFVILDDVDDDGIFTSSINGSALTKDIQSGQAFFVQTLANGAASLTINESSKSTVTNNLAFRPATVPDDFRASLYLLNTDSSTIIADGVLAQFNNSYSDSVNWQDAVKLSNINEGLSLSRHGKELSIERRPILTSLDTMYLKLVNSTQRSYRYIFTMHTAQAGLTAILQDSYTSNNTPVNMNGNTTVDFNINANPASAIANRFKVVFKSSVPLPVTFVAINADQANKAIDVNWKVSTQINIAKYEVQHSTDGKQFSAAATVMAGTNSTGIYAWIDNTPATGNNYYRIVSIDNDGKMQYSNVVKVTIGKSGGDISVYPNPVSGSTIGLLMNNMPAGLYNAKLLNTVGEVIQTSTINHGAGSTTETILLNKTIAKGVYQLEIQLVDGSKSTIKVLCN